MTLILFELPTFELQPLDGRLSTTVFAAINIQDVYYLCVPPRGYSKNHPKPFISDKFKNPVS